MDARDPRRWLASGLLDIKALLHHAGVVVEFHHECPKTGKHLRLKRLVLLPRVDGPIRRIAVPQRRRAAVKPTQRARDAPLKKRAEVIRGTCYESGGTTPFWPWAQAIRSLLIDPSDLVVAALDDRAAMIAEIVPEIRNLIPDIEPASEMDPRQARFRLFESVTSFLSEIAISRPLLVVQPQ